jgi:hypothetical protein
MRRKEPDAVRAYKLDWGGEFDGVWIVVYYLDGVEFGRAKFVERSDAEDAGVEFMFSGA